MRKAIKYDKLHYMKRASSIAASLFILFSAAPLFAEWPERGLTLVTSNPRTMVWSGDETDIRAVVLQSITPRLSRELGVPVNLIFRPAASGVLAANMMIGARPDGYILGALGGDAAISRVIQGFTPYVWSEFAPLNAAWRTVYALVGRADEKAGNLRELFEKNEKPRLGHSGLEPMAVSTILASEAARVLGFSWELVKLDSLDPSQLLEGRADFMVMPLGLFERHPHKGRLKVLTVFARDRNIPCAAGLPNLSDQNIDIELNPPFAFYLPAHTHWRIRSRLSQALGRALREPNVMRDMEEACLTPLLQDSAAAPALLNREYEKMKELLGSQGDE